MRAFIAIRLPESALKTLSNIQEKLKPINSGIIWTKPQNLHLTVKFLGEISEGQLNKIKEVTEEAARTTPAFRLKLERLVAFPSPRAARIIWAGSKQAPAALKQLAANLENRIAETGIPKEKRDFRAHVTIGRVKTRSPAAGFQMTLDNAGIPEDINCEFDCEKITLFESVLGDAGPVYRAIEEFNLKII